MLEGKREEVKRKFANMIRNLINLQHIINY